jgi:hypothetical protein
MARKPLTAGRRATPSTTTASGPTDFAFDAGPPPEVVPTDSYDVRVVGARPIHYRKSGAAAVELTLETDAGAVVDLDSLLVYSPGGDSGMTRRNQAMLQALAGLDEVSDVRFQQVLDALNAGTVRAEVTLYVGTAMDGRPINKLSSVDAIIEED